MTCERKEKNIKNCTCSHPSCENHGVCCMCISYHRKAGELPGCFFDSKTEKTDDRSVANYLKMHSNKE